MRRWCLLCLMILSAVLVADDWGPGLHPGEASALRIVEFQITPEVQARRCDALLEELRLPRSPPRLDQHRAIVAKFGDEFRRARDLADGFYRRAGGVDWPAARDAHYARLRERVERRPIDSRMCLGLASELDRRLRSRWVDVMGVE